MWTQQCFNELNLFEFICCSLFRRSVAWMRSWLVCNTYEYGHFISWHTRLSVCARYLLLLFIILNSYDSKMIKFREKVRSMKNRITWPEPKQNINIFNVNFISWWSIIFTFIMRNLKNHSNEPNGHNCSASNNQNILKFMKIFLMGWIYIESSFIQLWLNFCCCFFWSSLFIQAIVNC